MCSDRERTTTTLPVLSAWQLWWQCLIAHIEHVLCCLPRRTTHTHSLLDTARIMAGSKLLFQLCHFFVPRFCESAWPQVPNTHWSLVCVVQLRAHTHTHSHNFIFFRQFCTSLGLQFPCDLLVRSLLTSLSSCFVFFSAFLLLTQQNCVQAEGTHTHTHIHSPRYNPVCLAHRYLTSPSWSSCWLSATFPLTPHQLVVLDPYCQI